MSCGPTRTIVGGPLALRVGGLYPQTNLVRERGLRIAPSWGKETHEICAGWEPDARGYLGKWGMMRRRIVVSITAVLAMVFGLVVVQPASSAQALTPGLSFSADHLPTWQTNGVVRALAVSQGRVVVGGDFTQIRPGAGQSGSARAMVGLAILDAATGAPTTCQLPVSGGAARVNTVEASPDGTTVFVGGDFGSIGGVSRSRLAEIDVASCTVRAFSVSSISSVVRSLEVTADAVYFGGTFQSVAGLQRRSFAKVDRTGALDQNFVADAVGNMLTRPEPGVECRVEVDANTQGTAIEISPDGSTVILGGSFYTVNGVNTHSIAAIDATTGAVTRAYPANPNSWNSSSNFIHPCSFTKAITSDNSAFYIGNEGSGGGVFDGAARISWSSFNQEWRDRCLGAVQALALKDNQLYQAHHHHDCSWNGSFPDGRRIYLSVTDVNDPTQQMITWFPALNDGTGEGIGPRALAVAQANGAEYFWAGGEFTRVNGTEQQGLTRFGTTDTGNPPTPGINARAVTSGSIQVSTRAVIDPDDGPLQYVLYRNNVQIGQPITASSNWWVRPQVTFVDTNVVPGVSYAYRIRAIDGAGNQSALSGSVSATALASGSAYAETVLADDPAVYWRYDDQGVWVIDRSGEGGAGKNGQAQNGVTYTGGAIPGDASSSAVFDGVSQYIWNDQRATGPSTYSVETWFKTASTTGGVMVNYGNGRPRTDTGVDVLSTNYDRLVYMENATGRIRFGVYDGTQRTLRSAKAYNDDQWHHLVATQGPTGMRLYVDGLEVGRNSITATQSYFGSWHVGGDNLNGWPDNGGNSAATRFYDGQLDETAIYSQPLSQAQVIGHYQAGGGDVQLNEAPADAYGAAVFEQNPSLYWRFDETEGAVAEDASLIGQTTGTIGSAVTRVTDNLKFEGGAVQTPGTANNGVIASSVSTSGPSTYSTEFWINTTTTQGGKLVGFENVASGNASSYDRQVFMLNDGRVRFGVYTGSAQTITTSGSLNDGKWHHVVAAQDAAGMRLYVDGALRAQNSVAGNQAFDGFWRIGGGNLNSWANRPSSDYFSGRIDEVAIYQGALSADAVESHYVLGLQDTVAPSVPAEVTHVGSDTASLTWTASSDENGVAGYRIYGGDTADFVVDPTSLVGDVQGVSWVDPDEAPGTRFYRVSAYDLTGNESVASDVLEVVVADVTAPTVVTGLSATANETDVSLEWDASSDNVAVDHYRIYRGTTPDFSIEGVEPVAETGTVEYVDSALAEGQWYYRVVAVDAVGNVGTPSEAAGALVDIDTDAPTVPVDLTGSIATDGSVDLAWSAATDDFGVVGYRVFRGATEGFVADTSTMVAEGVEETSYQGDAPGIGTWYYRVAAYDGASNQSEASASVAVTVVDGIAPSVPGGVQVAATGLDAQVTWTASTDNIAIGGYRVFRGATSNFVADESSVVGTVSETSFAEAGLTEGDHYYRVAAVDTAGNVSAASAAVKATAVAPDTVAPSVPGGVAASASAASVALSWSASTDNVGVSGYSVFRGASAGFVADAASKVADVTGTSYTDAGLAAGTYFYRVVAVDAAGNASAASDAVQSTIAEPAGEPVEVVVPITEDSMTAQSVPNRLYGTTNQLSSRLTSGPLESFLRLALPEAPAGTVLTEAVLSVSTSTDASGASADAHEFDLVSGSWDEDTITWNNRPTTSVSDVLGTLTGATALNTAYSVSLDAAGLSAGLGSSVTLRMSGTGGDNVRLWSAEAGIASARPSLTLVFTPVSGPTDPEPTDPEPQPEPDPAPDTAAPSTPGGVGAAAAGETDIAISWAASTDDVGVTGYSVFRGATADFVADAASKVADVTGLSYTDAGLVGGTYFYRVIAVDAAGNASSASEAAQVTIPEPDPGTDPEPDPGTGPGPEPDPEPEPEPEVGETLVTIAPVADTMVASNNANGIYGATNQLSSRGINGTLESFLDFELPAAPAGMTLTGVALTVWTSTDVTATSADNHDIVLMQGPWDEATMTWNNRISTVLSEPIGQFGPMPALNTEYSTALSAAGLSSLQGQKVTLRIASTGADNMRIWSKDVSNATFRPALVLTYTAG